jgi:hypothetical protein
MHKVIDNLYVGGDSDYQRLTAATAREGLSVLRCCKEGPDGHREVLSYTTQGAPKGADYLSAYKRETPGRKVLQTNHLALNFIDPHDPHFIQREMMADGLKFIHERIKAGDRVLVACNAGKSRGPTTAMLYLRSIGELPGNFVASERIFRTLCPSYDPNIGVRQFAKTHWDSFDNTQQER